MNVRRTAVVMAVAAGSAGAVLVSSGIATAGPAHSAVTKHLSFYERNTSLTYTPKGGKPSSTPPSGPPAPGSELTFTDRDYVGSRAHHAKTAKASDFFDCVFSAKDVPACKGEIAIGGSMLLVKGTGGQGTFTIPVVGGTGSFLHARGTLKIADIGETLNANIKITVHKK